MQLKSPEGEAGRLPHTQLLPFNNYSPVGVGEWSMEGKGGQGKDGGLGVASESRMVILLPSGFDTNHLYF